MEKLDLSEKNLRNFGVVVMGCALPAFALLVWVIRHKNIATPCVVTAGLCVAIGLAAPALLKPVYCAWMKFAHVLGWINSRILLAVMFYGILTPLGLAMKLAGKDPLGKKPRATLRSYWLKKEAHAGYLRQF